MSELYHIGGELLTCGGALAVDEACCDDGTSPCSHCLDDLMPDQLQIDIDGLITLGPCIGFLHPTCEFQNATYLLTRTADCTWAVGFVGGCCKTAVASYGSVGAALSLSGGDYILTVTLTSVSPSGWGTIWRHNFGTTKPDCLAWSNLELTYVSNSCSDCDATASTCLATAA